MYVKLFNVDKRYEKYKYYTKNVIGRHRKSKKSIKL